MGWTGMLIGHAEEGNGTSAARVSVMIGHRDGPVGHAWAAALASAAGSVPPFVVAVRPGMPVRPMTVFVPAAEASSAEHQELTRGAAHAGVATGIRDSLSSGLIPPSVAEGAVMILKTWVDPAASLVHQDVVCLNNRNATRSAIQNARHEHPTIDEVVAHSGPVGNAFYTP